jgi:hypothetical protein
MVVQRHAELESAAREEGEDSAFIAQHQLARTLTRDNRERHLEEQERNRRDDAPNASEYGELKEEKPRRRRWDPVHRFKRLELRAKLWWTSERSLQRESYGSLVAFTDRSQVESDSRSGSQAPSIQSTTIMLSRWRLV